LVGEGDAGKGGEEIRCKGIRKGEIAPYLSREYVPKLGGRSHDQVKGGNSAIGQVEGQSCNISRGGGGLM